MRINAAVARVAPPPIADVQQWVQGLELGADRPLLDVAQAVPSYPPAEALRRHVGALAMQSAASRYTPILGLPDLRAAVAGHLSEDYGSPVAAREVAITAGCNQGFCLAISALAGPGDEVILPLPYYFNHRMWLDMQGITAVHLPMPAAGPAAPDPRALEALISDRTAAIVVVSPGNPTGLECSPSALAAIHEVAAAAGVALVLDETYKDFRTTAGPPHRLFDQPRWRDTLVQLWSFSKSYSLAGYRVGTVVAGEDFLAQLEKVMDCVAICASRVSQEAALFGLRHLRAWREEKARLMATRRERLAEGFRHRNLAYELLSCGAFFAYLRHPFAGRSATEVARWLAREHGVMCVPGDMFGPGQDRHLRLAFANLEAEHIPTLIERLAGSQHQTPPAPDAARGEPAAHGL